MFSVALFLIIFLVIFLLALGVPLLIGIFVYCDADKRVDCNPWLWALIAALAPSFVGLIIYLIVRKDFPPKEVKYHYDENGLPVAPVKKGLPTWAKVLIIVSVILLLVCILGGCGVFFYAITQTEPMIPDQLYYEF